MKFILIGVLTAILTVFVAKSCMKDVVDKTPDVKLSHDDQLVYDWYKKVRVDYSESSLNDNCLDPDIYKTENAKSIGCLKEMANTISKSCTVFPKVRTEISMATFMFLCGSKDDFIDHVMN